MQLKPYQADALAILRRLLESARTAGPEAAFNAITAEPEQAKRLGAFRAPYRPLNNRADTPSVCLRLPTGGGKTILATHAIAIARDAWLDRDYALVLWLVPSNTIRTQTVDALKKPGHPYRAALDTAFEGRVRIFDIADFTTLRPHDLSQNCCIVVATIQTLRVENTEGRKVYDHNEELEAHFIGIPQNAPDLERDSKGRLKYSFANLLHRQRPLMIVDEAHNAVSGLSVEIQSRVNPAAIIEFTATPRPPSNVLHNVTAQELKAAEMIKLPIRLVEHLTWQNAVTDAVATRARLAASAGQDPAYIRPIILFQAQDRNGEVPAEALRNHLVEVEQIPPDRIAIVTGEQRELDGIDLFDPACKIEAVITVQALKEGWDCSFAYVFCSLARIRSARDVEQLLGRVLRMPYAAKRPIPELNRAYAFVSEPEFGAAAAALRDKLVNMGFDETDAQDAVEQVAAQADLGPLFDPAPRPAPTFTHVIQAPPETLAALAEAGVTVTQAQDGARIALPADLPQPARDAIAALLPAPQREGFAEALAAFRMENLPPATRGEVVHVPSLYAQSQGSLVFADTDIFIEDHDWSLSASPGRLTPAEFTIQPVGNRFEIDLHNQRVTFGHLGDTHQPLLDIDVEGWTDSALVLWLNRQLRDPQINPNDLFGWLADAVHHLTVTRRIPIAALMQAKFLLERALRARIETARAAARRNAYQTCLFAPTAHVEISFDHAFTFSAGMYDDQRRYRGPWRPNKHFFGPDHLPGFDGAANGEEIRCAQALDALPQVETWIRNVARHPRSFSLPTATDKFYPDFLARLTNGRLFAVEYKGADRYDNPDSVEKRAIGELWERQSAGQCLFLMPSLTPNGLPLFTQLQTKLVKA